MNAIYLRRANLGSLLLRSCMWSSWSHCGVLMPDATVIEAAAFHGVIRRPFDDVARGASQFAMRSIEVPDDDAAYAFAASQIGKPYDWVGAFGLALHREWDEPDAWYCSEYLEAAVVAGGRRRFINQPRRITPQLSWMVA